MPLMDLAMNVHLAEGYRSPSQRARRITEGWFEENMYCAACPSPRLARAPGSTQVVDFTCESCGAEYQVKAKAGTLGPRLRDAAFDPMMARAIDNRSPHFAFLGYESSAWRVRSLILVPGHFITPGVIEKCRPLSRLARRAGWVGCNILASRIPPDGRLAVVENAVVTPPQEVRRGWADFAWLSGAKAEARGWTVDVLACVRSLGPVEFTLRQFYEHFEEELASRHPDNRNVQPKIRQQLQFLRHRGIVRFLGRGRYVAE
jgi:type II restriction enzyme